MKMDRKSVKIRYIKSKSFKTSLTTGVYGGLSGNGLINLNFYTDRVMLPDYQIVDVDLDGRPMSDPTDHKDGDVAREVTFGTVMDVGTAKKIVSWLNGKIEEYEQLNE